MERALESRLDQIVRRQAELREALAAAGLSGADFAKLSKEYSELEPIVGGIEALRRAQEELSAATEMAEAGDDPELKTLAQEEIQTIRERLPNLELQVKLSLLPRDEDDERNAILEIRAGTGGDEAALFAADLFRMYQRYAGLHGWRFEMLDLSETGIGGVKGAVAPLTRPHVFAPPQIETRVPPGPRVPGTQGSGPHPTP